MAEERLRLIAEGYDRVATEYIRLETDAEWPRMRWLARILDELPPGSRILDLGCGNGLPATKAAAAEHEVFGVDVSARMIEMARANVPEATFHVGSVETVDLPTKYFDAAVAFYLFDHIPRGELRAILARIHGWLTSGGLLLATFEAVDQPDTVGDWLGVPMFFSCFPPERTKRVVEEAGFHLRAAQIEAQTEGSKEIQYLWVIGEAKGHSL